jgi:hypothetical protein
METPWLISANFWAGVIVTTILAILVSLAVAWYQTDILELRQKQQSWFHSRSYQKQKTFHTFIVQLRERKTDRHLYMLRLATSINMSFIAGLMCFLTSGIFYALRPMLPGQPEWHISVLLFVSGFFFGWYQTTTARYGQIIVDP